MQEIRDLGGRLDVMVTITIIKFVYLLCVKHASTTEIVLLSAILSVSMFCLRSVLAQLSPPARMIAVLLQKVGLLVLSQGCTSLLGIDSATLYTADAPPAHVVQSMTVATKSRRSRCC